MSRDSDVIQRVMGPLAERFGLRVVKVEDLPHASEVWYANRTTGLKVRLDWDEFRPFLTIARLGARGRFPEEPIFPRSPPTEIFDLDHLILLRAGRIHPVGALIRAREASQAEECLRAYAKAAEAHAADVLEGDFSVFPELTRGIAAGW